MKFASYFFNILLAVPFLKYAIAAVQHYNDVKLYSDAGLADKQESAFLWIYIIGAVLFLVGFKIALFLNIRKKYRQSLMISGTLLLVYLVVWIFKLTV